jgi:hypothetical protein
MAITEDQAAALIVTLLDAGRSPSDILEIVAAYWGESGQSVALGLLEEHEAARPD